MCVGASVRLFAPCNQSFCKEVELKVKVMMFWLHGLEEIISFDMEKRVLI